MNRTEPSAAIPSTATGPFVTLSNPLGATGSGARSRPRTTRALVTMAFLAATLGLTAASASAAVPPNFCPEGSGAGQCNVPKGVAVDQSSGDGDVYVADENNRRIDVFGLTGVFERAFGWGVKDGAEELQVCTTFCQRGIAGAGAGEIQPVGVAVDNSGGASNGDVYVTDKNNGRVEKFTPAGAFILAFGSSGSGPGQLNPKNEAPPVAVDASGDVWVGDVNRLEKFGEAGEFLSEIPLPGAGAIAGLAIDTDPSSPSFEDLYALNKPVKEVQRVSPPLTGKFTLSFEGHTSRAFEWSDLTTVFEEAAAEILGQGNFSLGFGSTSFSVEFKGRLEGRDVPQLEVSPGGSVTTERQGVPAKVSKLSPAGTLLETIDESGYPKALGLDPATGDVYIADQIYSGFASAVSPASLLRYDSSGLHTETFATGGVLGGPLGNALAFGDSAERLYVTSTLFATGVQAFPVPAEGPLPEENSEKAEPIGKTTATLNASVNPEGKSTTVHFQYVDAESFEKEGGFSSPHTKETEPESAPLGEDFAQHPVPPVPITGLQPETTYRFRLVATNECQPVKEPGHKCVVDGETASFTTEPPVRIDATYVLGVSAIAATLRAEVNPLGDPAEYRFEYLTQAEYEANIAEGTDGFSGPNSPSLAPVPDGQIAATEEELTLSHQIAGLQPATAYRYRAFFHNAVAPSGIASAVGSFTTQSTAAAAALPDGRQWEQVTPPNKFGAQLQAINSNGALIKAAAEGQRFTSVASGPLGPQAKGTRSPLDSQWLSVRAPAGWSTSDITTPHEMPCQIHANNANAEYYAFTEDLQSSIVRTTECEDLLSPFASEQTPYRREANGEFVPLLVGCPEEPEPCPQPIAEHANVPPGAKFSDVNKLVATPTTPDLSHVLLESEHLLTDEFQPGFAGIAGKQNVYELSAAKLTLVSVLPDGEPASEAGLTSEAGTGNRSADSRGAISADGERVVFSTHASGEGHLYLRINATRPQSAVDGSGHCTEPAKACTIQLDAAQGGLGGSTAEVYLQGANRDSTKVFFRDDLRLTADSKAEPGPTTTDLYMCEIGESEGHPACALSDLSVTVNPGEAASVMGDVSAIDASGRHLFFAARGVLTNAPNPRGEVAEPDAECSTGPNGPAYLTSGCNFYAYDTETHRATLIAVLSSLDEPDWGGNYSVPRYMNLTARTTSDGGLFTFMSRRPLTGYDNRDAISGQRDEEVFIYDSASEALRCVSCNPTGARPHGVLDPAVGPPFLLVDGSTSWASIGRPSIERWLAASIPGWTGPADQYATYQSRYLSDSRRLFFNSSDALVPTDTNGVMDVYEYEPPGVGDCSESSPTFGKASGGCVSLISSGTSRDESAFLDASESGDDVFFLTAAKLAATDIDTAYDVYDAHSCSAESPCPPPPPSPPPACEGDACQPPAAPPNHPTPGTALLNGPGNVVECPKAEVKRSGKCVAKKHKAKKHKKSHKRHAKGRAANHRRRASQ